jgi:hypothetical protein
MIFIIENETKWRKTWKGITRKLELTLFEDGVIKSVLSEEQESDIWMSWDEGWQWVINSLEKIADEYEHKQENDI